MAAKRYVLGLALGAALAATTLAGCDRLDQVACGAQGVIDQVGGGTPRACGTAGNDKPAADLPVETRAVFGVQMAAVEPPPMSEQNLQDLLQTQSFFAVGSVIAMPKVQIVQPVLEPETYDATPAEAAPAASGVASVNTADAPLPESAAVAAGPPVVEAPTPAAGPAPAPAPGGKPGIVAGKIPLGPRLPPSKTLSAGELKQQAQVLAPRAQKQAVIASGIQVSKDALVQARRAGEQQIAATSKTAQTVGDDIARKVLDKGAPIPKALAIRTKLAPDVAIAARDKLARKMEALGLPNVVTASEGGQMRITIGVTPTQFRDKHLDLSKVNQMRALFAPQRGDAKKECAGNPDAAKLQADPVLATECVVKVLQDSGEYEYVEKDYIFTNQMLKKPSTQPITVVNSGPNDPLFKLQWSFMDNGAAAGQSAGGAGFSSFWTKAKDTGSRDVVVAVVDTGIQMNHPDIKGSPNLAPGYDMVSDPAMGNDGDGRDADPNDPGDKCDPDDPTQTDTFHGTHVAGTIGVASTNNQAGVAGGNWNVTIVPVRALGRCGGKLSDINDAIRWAAGTVPARDLQGKEVWNSHPADIINLSIGLFEPCPASMQSAINDAVAAGAIVVAAAGNSRVDAKYFAPGGCDNVVSVAANDARGVLTPYSNYGPKVTIMAPGGDMSRDDDHDGRPDGILSTKYSKDCYDPTSPTTKVPACYYSYENGTSMAAPHVSAALALIKAKYPSAVPSELKSMLMKSTIPRTQLQCSGKCTSYPGSTPIAGSPDMCFRPCGGVMLNMANAPGQ